MSDLRTLNKTYSQKTIISKIGWQDSKQFCRERKTMSLPGVPAQMFWPFLYTPVLVGSSCATIRKKNAGINHVDDVRLLSNKQTEQPR